MLSRKMHFLLFLSIICTGLVACDNSDPSNGLPSPPGDTVDPKVSKAFPKNDKSNFETDEIVRLEFSELMDENSLENGGIQLFVRKGTATSSRVFEERDQHLSFSQIPGVGRDPVTGDEIDIEVTVVNLQPPKKRFSLSTTYTVRVFDSAKDIVGNVKKEEGDTTLQQLADFSFSIEDGQWQLAHLVEVSVPDPVDITNNLGLFGDVFDPQIASNSKGDILAVWRQATTKNGAQHIVAGRYLANDEIWRLADLQSSSTSSAEFIDADLVEDVFAPVIEINKSGLAVVAWYQKPSQGATTSVWINIFDGSAWLGASDILENSPSSAEKAESPIVAVDDEGNILVAWREFDSASGFFRIRSGFYDQTIDTDTGKLIGLTNVTTFVPFLLGNGNDLQLKITSQGFAILVWAQEVNGVSQIYTSRYFKNTGWETALRIDNEQEIGNASAPSLAIDENNDAFAIWQQFDGIRENIWSNRYAGGGWGTALLMETDNLGDADEPHVSTGRDNQAFAIWQQDLGSSKVLKARLFENADWAPLPETLASIAGTIKFSKPIIRFDREGNAMAVWMQGDGELGSIVSNEYSELTSSWKGATNMNGFGFTNRSLRGVVLEPILEDGRMLALWSQSDGSVSSLASALFSE